MTIILELIALLLTTFQISTAIEVSGAAPNLSEESRWRYSSLIASASAEYDIDPILVTAIIWNESDFRNITVKRTEDYGVIQVHWQTMGRNEHWLDGVTKEDLMIPEINIPVGVGELAFWKESCRKRGHLSRDHFWVGHYKAGNVIRSDRYERRILRRINRLNRAKISEASKETPRRRSTSARRKDEHGADGQMSRSETGISFVSVH